MKNNQVKNGIDAEPQFIRKVSIIFLIIISIICVNFAVLYSVNNIRSLKNLVYIYAMLHILWLVLLLSYKDIPIDPLIKMYLAFISIALYPMACIYWNSGNAVVFFWFPLIIIGVIVFRVQNIMLWIFLILALTISIFFFSPLFPQEDFSPLLIKQVNILTIISTLSLAAFFVIVHFKREDYVPAEIQQTTAEADNIERNKALYQDIINYLEQNKPFKNPSFNAYALAKALNTNVNYISKAISTSGNDFHTLLNIFRINYVKSMLDNGAMKKYTIDYIYSEAGYKHRSTFNTAFKNVTGMTPSDYVSQQSIDDNS